MSARQAFVPNALSRAPSSESHSHPTDAGARDGDRDMFVNGNGKARSVAAFLGQKRGSRTDGAAQGAGPTQGTGLGRANASSNRRSFEGIRRPEMTPMSIIPYPTATEQQLSAGVIQPGAGQTPRKIVGPGPFGFSRPMTPVSVPRGPKNGFGTFTESREDEVTLNADIHGSGAIFMGPGSEAGVRMGAGAGIGGYMRGLDGSGAGNTDGTQSNLENDMPAPVPGYMLGELGANPRPEGYEVDSIFARSSRPLDAMTEKEVSDSQRFGGTKRGMRYEDMEGNGRYSSEGDQPQGSAKKMKRVQHDPDEYFPISSPHIPPTPGLPPSTVDALDPSLVASSLFENLEEFVNLEEIAADWKRWGECTREEWLKGADELAQGWADLLNMVRGVDFICLIVYDMSPLLVEQAKDHLTEKVLAYANMISSVEERRTKLNRDIKTIQGEGNIFRKKISELGRK